MECLEIGLDSLKLEEVYAVAYQNKRVILTHNAKERIRKAHSFLLSEIKAGKTLYGVNTGFGSLANVKIPEHQIAELQIN
ncbi:MAG: aromatic amino acid lyase, partial [Deltaproteobacteria bacterium]|nr:aromatic amino acid lyase [Deltaproteobacteria bacterium]